MTAALPFVPNNLSPYTRPSSYVGATWEGWFCGGFSCHRESDLLEKCNWETVVGELRARGVNIGEGVLGDSLWTRADDDAQPDVVIVRESHCLVGWVSWLAVKPTAYTALAMLNQFVADVDDYPVLDDDAFSNLEWDTAADYWESLDWRDRLDYLECRGCSIGVSADWRDAMRAVRGDFSAALDCGLEVSELAN